MASSEATISIIDDDEAVRSGLAVLVKSWGWNVETHASAQAFLDNYDPTVPGCLVVDLRMPGMDGFALQRAICDNEFESPVIFISGHGNIPDVVRAIQAGAIDFLVKPFSDKVLFDRISNALVLDAQRRREGAFRRQQTERFATLTPRERQVMQLLCAGKSGVQIAAEFGISYKTLEKFRGQVMAKMQAGSMAELTVMAISLGLLTEGGQPSAWTSPAIPR